MYPLQVIRTRYDDLGENISQLSFSILVLSFVPSVFVLVFVCVSLWNYQN